jgi:uncharacterized protein (DUF433 family)
MEPLAAWACPAFNATIVAGCLYPDEGLDMSAVIETHIEITPGVCGGKPRIAGHRITVADVAVWHEKNGLSIDEIANEYHLTLAEVYAALAYYHDHRAEIDAKLEADRRFVVRMRKKHPSRLARKLKELSHG